MGEKIHGLGLSYAGQRPGFPYSALPPGEEMESLCFLPFLFFSFHSSSFLFTSNLSAPRRRERLPTPVFWPGEFHELIVHGVAKSWTQLSSFHFHFRWVPTSVHWNWKLAWPWWFHKNSFRKAEKTQADHSGLKQWMVESIKSSEWVYRLWNWTVQVQTQILPFTNCWLWADYQISLCLYLLFYKTIIKTELSQSCNE